MYLLDILLYQQYTRTHAQARTQSRIMTGIMLDWWISFNTESRWTMGTARGLYSKTCIQQDEKIGIRIPDLHMQKQIIIYHLDSEHLNVH